MKLFVWDFHGTLEKGNENAVLLITNKILKNNGYHVQMSIDQNAKLYGKKWFEYFQFLLPAEGLDRCIKLQKDCVDYEKRHPEIVKSFIKPNDYSHEVLKKIRASGNDQIIITNTVRSAFLMFMQATEIEEFFPFETKVFTTNLHDRHSTLTKRTVLEDYLKGKQYESIVVIGDRGPDVELAQFINGISYLYAHPGKDFFDCEADWKIRDLREILREV